ncbi:MAG: hypothetical protein NVS9B14_20110 [Candidatus Acidiferrum sp.]
MEKIWGEVPIRLIQHLGESRRVSTLEIPLYQLFYDGDEPPKLPNLLKRKTADDIVWGK